MVEITEDNWYNEFVNYVVRTWEKKGGKKLEDEEKARELIDAMMFLMGSYKKECLLATILDLYSLQDKFNKESIVESHKEDRMSKKDEMDEKQIEEQGKVMEEKLKELTALIDSYKGLKAGFAEWACVEIAVRAGDTHYEQVGILEVAKLGLREDCLEIWAENAKEEEEEAKQKENPPKEYKPPFISDAVN